MEEDKLSNIVPTYRLTKIRDQIESFDKGQQMQILKRLSNRIDNAIFL